MLGPILTKALSTDGTIHSGSIFLKERQELESLNTGILMQTNGGLAGGNIQLLSQNNLFNFGKMQASGAITAGSVLLKALNQLSNYSDAPKRIEAKWGNYGGYIKLKATEFVNTPAEFVPIQLQATSLGMKVSRFTEESIYLKQVTFPAPSVLAVYYAQLA